ncbi:hypothetical protein D9V62_00400 [Buchnera aphidicola (Aphis helianthi)]|uniref:Flagellar motor switch protein FliM n=1 Tax=Buchnera aphidicola (Aphis helianthi) TaxID=2315802 RepID=A0A4D6XVW1_9GAMM|nr:hypothetical protein [Buchnera aphidicola]QCI16915.1 hypothetical protein D9V62_00400 [Buchnera aphidicola (Aphis helianthi)]
MGKSNYLNVINKETNKKEEILNILSVDRIKILEKINENFIKKTITYFSKFIKNHIKLNFFSIKVNSYTDNDTDIKYLFSNEIKISNSKEQSFIFFSDNLLSVFIDLLFGGNGNYIEKINKERNISYTEKIISEKLMKLICTAYCKAIKKFYSIDMKVINIKIVDIKKLSYLNQNYITNYFNFSINNISIFFSILFPISIIEKNFQQINSLKVNKQSLIKNVNCRQDIAISNLYDVELDVIVKLIMSSKVNCNSLSIGDILMIKSPEKVLAYIEKIPIFLGHYKNFDKKSVIFLKKFIHKNLDLNKYEEFFNE